MKYKAVAAVAAVLIAGAPAVASARPIAPVSVSSQVQSATIGGSLYQQGEVRLSFVNRARVTASEVDLSLSTHGRVLGYYTARGSFAPGVTINRFFTTQQGARDQKIHVSKVKFTDGTVWNSNDALSPRRQAVLLREGQ